MFEDRPTPARRSADPAITAADDPGQAGGRTASGGKDAIRPFKASFPKEAIADLRRRIAATQWPERETVPDDSQGVQLKTLQALADYWLNHYDWSRCQARLDALPQFVTEIDGLDIHFIHVRSKHDAALPLIITHGWPGSVIEQLKVIAPLTDPTAHGGKASDAFHVVIPSIPGYGFSAKPTTTGWDPPRIARAWVTLMQRLGYPRFVAQGGDWGAIITELTAVQSPEAVIGIHSNMPGVFPAEVTLAVVTGAPPPAGLKPDETRAYESFKDFFSKHAAYAFEMGARPQTLYGVSDSPIGLAAWILDHDKLSYEMMARAIDGKTEGLSRDDILDNITLYWLTNTGVSSARLYWEHKGGFFDVRKVQVPVAVSVFPDELFEAPRSWAEKAYPKLIHYNRLDRGGHFAAWEQPDLFTRELRDGFRTLRPS